MNQQELRDRTKAFALRVIRLVGALPRNRVADVIARQVLRSGTSIGANYREALRASSKRHFISTCEIVLREADETHYWLELLIESKLIEAKRLQPLLTECNELLAIFAATVRSAKARGK
jgi:four helix bundle protein